MDEWTKMPTPSTDEDHEKEDELDLNVINLTIITSSWITYIGIIDGLSKTLLFGPRGFFSHVSLLLIYDTDFLSFPFKGLSVYKYLKCTNHFTCSWLFSYLLQMVENCFQRNQKSRITCEIEWKYKTVEICVFPLEIDWQSKSHLKAPAYSID